MLFSVLSGYKMISVKGAVKKSEEVEKKLEYLCNLVTYVTEYGLPKYYNTYIR
jgi:hypothetical protein